MFMLLLTRDLCPEKCFAIFGRLAVPSCYATERLKAFGLLTLRL